MRVRREDHTPLLAIPVAPPFPGGIQNVNDYFPSAPVEGQFFRGQYIDTNKPTTVKIVPEAVFKRMHEYSLSMPTGPSIGRYWKRWQRGLGWLYAEVVPASPGFKKVAWSTLKLHPDQSIPVRRRGIPVRHHQHLIDTEYTGDTVLILSGEHAGQEGTLMGPLGEGWSVLLEDNSEITVPPYDLESLC